MKLLMIVCLMLSLTLTVSAQDTVQTNDAPYIYYYSDALNGFIIERADGTDSRIIGQGVMEEPASALEGPGWSPSGKWIAWRNYSAFEGYVISVDGREIEFLDQFACVHTMVWHPDKDILLIHGTIQKLREELREVYYAQGKYWEQAPCTRTRYPVIMTYWLIDVEENRLIASTNHEVDEGYLFYYWFDDYVQLNENTFFPAGRRFVSIKMNFDGRVEITPISETEHKNFDENVLEGEPLAKYSFSSEYRFDYWMLDYETTPNSRILNSSSARPGFFAWLYHSSSNWLFAGFDMCDAGCGTEVSGILGRINIYNTSTNHNREIADCRWGSEACIGWLPEQVDISYLPPGQGTSVLSTPLYFIDHGENWGNRLRDTHILECNGEIDPPVRNLVVNLETNETDFVLPNAEPCTISPENEETPYRYHITFVLSPDGNYYAMTDHTEYTSLYDAKSGDLLTTLNIFGQFLSFSEDSKTLTTVARFLTAVWDVQQLVENSPY